MGYHSQIRASAVAFVNGEWKGELHYRLGSNKQHTVFEGGLVRTILGLHLLDRVTNKDKPMTGSTENQAMFSALPTTKVNWRSTYSRRLSKESLEEQGSTKADTYPNTRIIDAEPAIPLEWVPGHMGAKGNKAADQEARDALEFGSSDNKLPPFLWKQLPESLTATCQQLN